MSRTRSPAVLVAALLALPSLAGAQEGAAMEATQAAALEYTPLEVPGFDPGMKMALIHGDPSVPDQPYTLRLSFPDGYRFPAHYHPKAENLTVLSGTFLLAMGEEEDEDLTEYAPGDYLYIPPTHPHYGGARGETVIQLHGVGPFDILLVEEKPAASGR